MKMDEMSIFAFDFDGTLHKDDVLEVYDKAEKRDGVKTAIVSSNPPILLEYKMNKLEVNPDMRFSAMIKTPVLESIPNRFESDISKKVYIGNRITDKIFSKMAGYEFYSVDSIISGQGRINVFNTPSRIK